MSFPSHVRIVEVGPRDGLQNEKQPISVADKVALINALSNSGLSYIEAGSFVSPKWVPQMAGSAEVFEQIKRSDSITYAALTPNMQGFEAAMAAGVKEVAVFAAASESFSQKNINCSISESLQRFEPVMEAAKQHDIRVRGYVSCVLGCPYEGEIAPEHVRSVAQALYDMGCYEISLGDTIGVGTAAHVYEVMRRVTDIVPKEKIAGHFHDTYGQALANILASMQTGVSIYHSSVAGLGGCPYAKGATGNVATEDVLYMLHGMGIETGMDLDKTVQIGQWISDEIGRRNASSVGRAMVAKCAS